MIALLDKIDDIYSALKSKSYLSALSLSLTLPDICGKIEHPDFKLKDGERNIGKQYATWFNDWVNHYFADHSGWIHDGNRAKNPYFSGKMCYSLRCAFLHAGNSDIEEWGSAKDKDCDYSYEFELILGGADSYGSHWEYNSLNDCRQSKTKTIKVNIEKLCEYICLAAKKYYENKDPSLFKDHNIKLINIDTWNKE